MNNYYNIIGLKYLGFGMLFYFLSFTVLHSQTFIPAERIGQNKQLKEFIDMEMQFPEKSINEKQNGTVELSYIIDNKANITNINVKRSVSKEIDNEAIRILKKTLWKPATKFGKAVASRQILKIKFHYRKYKRLCKKRGYNNFKYSHLPVDTTFKIFEKDQLNKHPFPIFKKKFYSLNDFIIEHIKYPDAAFKQNISGLVVLNFVVEPYGEVSHIEIEKFLGGGCNEEAIRVLKLLKWKPGIVDNKAVRARMKIKIAFNLPDGSEHQYLPNNQNNTL